MVFDQKLFWKRMNLFIFVFKSEQVTLQCFLGYLGQVRSL
uniref:Uncharacterized protein n=1 Tax=Anguilla anguilla TaxID=7936 RepID=A0A0E9WJZ2_ANGAN